MSLKSIDEYVKNNWGAMYQYEHERYKEISLDDLFKIRTASCRKKNRERLSHVLIRKLDGTSVATKHSLYDLVRICVYFYDSERKKFEKRFVDSVLLLEE